jgi:hypothetical protein
MKLWISRAIIKYSDMSNLAEEMSRGFIVPSDRDLSPGLYMQVGTAEVQAVFDTPEQIRLRMIDAVKDEIAQVRVEKANKETELQYQLQSLLAIPQGVQE